MDFIITYLLTNCQIYVYQAKAIRERQCRSSGKETLNFGYHNYPAFLYFLTISWKKWAKIKNCSLKTCNRLTEVLGIIHDFDPFLARNCQMCGRTSRLQAKIVDFWYIHGNLLVTGF